MPFNLRMGVPEMEAFWDDLSSRKLDGKLDKDEEKFFKKTGENAGIPQPEPAPSWIGFTRN